MIDLFTSSEIYTTEEVSERLKIQVSTLRDKVFKNEIPYIKLGPGKRAPVRFYGKQLNEWLTENQNGNQQTFKPLPENPKIQKAHCKVVEDFEQYLENLEKVG